MNTTVKNTREFLKNKAVWERMKNSPLYLNYQRIFQSSTGLPLELQLASEEQVSVCSGSENQSKFCQLLNANEGCEKCLMAQRCLNQKGAGVQSMRCFAGLEETVIPIMAGSILIARLRTGQIFHNDPSVSRFRKIAESLGEAGSMNTGELEEAYLATPVVEKERYRATLTLLATFSMQLSKLAKHFYYEVEHKELDVMETAKDYIEENLTEVIHLDDVAEKASMSPHHFCRKFKEETGMTMTDYITQRRVDEAKTLLAESEMKVTDVAFEVGFQSLSQFNRSFSKLTEDTPSAYRKGLLAA